MNVRKSLFVVAAAGLLFSGSYLTERARHKVVRAQAVVADGTDPMPLPKPTRGGTIAADNAKQEVLVADGTDPMPRPPRKLA